MNDVEGTSADTAVRKIVKSPSSRPLVDIFIPGVKPSYRTIRARECERPPCHPLPSVRASSSRRCKSIGLLSSFPLARLLAALYIYLRALVWITRTCTCTLYYALAGKNRGSFGAHASVIDATCSRALCAYGAKRSATVTAAVRRARTEDATGAAPVRIQGPSFGSPQPVRTSITVAVRSEPGDWLRSEVGRGRTVRRE